MISSFVNIFRIPELRRKVLITLALFVVYRVGSHVPTPFIDPAKLSEHFRSLSGGGGQGAFSVFDMFSGGAFTQMTVFALGIMPYVSASIILQLLTVVWPRLERIAKEGEAGRKKINQWTRYGTVILSLFQGLGIGFYLIQSDLSMIANMPWVFLPTTAVTLAAGTCFIMWLGEKISEHGIGNGISLLIGIGIVARYPFDIGSGYTQAATGSMSWLAFILVLLVMAAVTSFIIYTQEASRKIPVQHARRVVGRKMMQGGSNHLPIKLNVAGVIPVIFASALLAFPQSIQGLIPGGYGRGFADLFAEYSNTNLYNFLNIQSGGFLSLLKVFNFYTLFYILLTVFFCYFYTAITFNPVDLADNLKKSGAFIPGRKPGKPTSDFINYILLRVTVVGSLSLIIVALVPHAIHASFDTVPPAFSSMAGGTGLIIVVGVFLDTLKQIESQLLMRHYEGFKYKGSGLGQRRFRR